MSEQGKRQEGVAGETDHEQHRAGPGEGVRAPFVEETGVSEISIFDGAGNESVVRVAKDAEGRVAQGAGPTSEAAEAEAQELLKESRVGLSDKFSPGKH
jgi:hypothetical protein